MKAIRFDKFGGPEVLRYEDAPDPVAGPSEVVIELTRSAVNHVDVDIRDGVSRFDFAMPHILGLEGAGTVIERGPAVSGVELGDRVAVYPTRFCGHCEWCNGGHENLCESRLVIGEHVSGTYAERIAVPAENAIHIPEGVSDTTAAATIAAFGTAWNALMNRADIRADDVVLIHSIGGGVASAALQICKLAGATVIGTGSADDRLARAVDDGADAVLNYNTTPDIYSAVMELTNGRGVDLVFDTVGGAAFVDSMSVMRPGGRLVSIGGHAGEVVNFDIVQFFRRNISYISSHTQTRNDIATLFRLVAAGKLSPRVHSSHPLRNAADAHRELSARGTYGKIVLDIG